MSDAVLRTLGLERIGYGPYLQNTYRKQQTNTTYDVTLMLKYKSVPHVHHIL